MLPEHFHTAKLAELAALRAAAEKGTLPAPLAGRRPDFAAALTRGTQQGPLTVIAEYKRASPSRGPVCRHIPVEEAVRQYAEAGATALSILTEEKYFEGKLDYLARAASVTDLPLLRKDFICDSLQVQATAATPAAALLLIVRFTPHARTLRHLREAAEALGMQAVVEVFDRDDLHLARESGARIIQVNARDLATLTVNREACLALARACPPAGEEIWIAASGMEKAEHLAAAAAVGYSAALVGTALMVKGQPGAALRELLAPAGRAQTC